MLHFVHPVWLFALLALPLVALVLLQGATRERKDLEGYAQRGALAKMGLWPSGNPQAWRGLLLAAALGCGLVALAEPRLGGGGGETHGTQDGSLVVVLDVSRSMLAQDMGGESRLVAAQRMIQKLLPAMAGWRVGLVAFAGEAQAIVPLTTDVSALETMLERAQPGQVPGKGSNMEAGLKAALPLYTRPGRRVALVFSDGEELSGEAANTVSALRDAQVEVDAVGLGTPEGGFIPGHSDVWGNPTYMTYRGEKVTSRLMEPALKRLSGGTGGFYIRAVEGGAGDLAKRLGALAGTPSIPEGKGQEKIGYELFQLPLALALLFLGLEAGLSLRGRRRSTRRFRDDLRAAMRRPATAMLLFAIAATQSGWTWYPSWLPNREAGQAFAAGDYQRAGDLLDGALSHDPGNFGLHYNRANVLFEQKKYQDAAVAYKRALELADPGAKPVIGYNLGNAYFREAEAGTGAAGYKKAIVEYERVLKAKPTDADAKHNLEVAKRRLKQQPPKQQQSGGQSGGQQNPGQQGAGQQKMPVGVNQTYKPPAAAKNLPSEGEVDSVLKALESDERQRQQEQGATEQSEESNGGPYAQQLLNQALGTLDLQKDW
ncbi:MAG: von Willebrand factor type [Cyanobacteria bacterium RYN_339]|nr:von Willebrand factor type [Cyanobacteria bacterium RYN_339]